MATPPKRPCPPPRSPPLNGSFSRQRKEKKISIEGNIGELTGARAPRTGWTLTDPD